MPVELVAEEEFETETPRLRLVRPEDEPTNAEQAYAMAPRLPEPKRQIDEQVIMLMERISRALAVRVILLIALCGVFALAWRAMTEPTAPAIIIVGLFGAVSVTPLVWLAVKGT